MKTSRAAWIPVLLLAAAAGFTLLHDPDARDRSVLSREIAGRSSLLGSLAALTAGAGISSSNPSTHSKPALESSRPISSPLERRPHPRSPLERSPGYYAPADPESLSVVTGRREAPAVSLELQGGAASLDALARAILGALHDRNEAALHVLGITRREFETICWPEFPESRPVTRITAEDAWSFSEASSRAGVGRMTGVYGGRDLELLQFESAGSFPYRNFVRHRGMTLLVRDRGTGEILRVASAPSWIERNGRFKVLLFKD